MTKRILLISALAVLFFCLCCCLLLVAAPSESTATPEADSTTPQPTQPPKPTNTPAPTAQPYLLLFEEDAQLDGYQSGPVTPINDLFIRTYRSDGNASFSVTFSPTFWQENSYGEGELSQASTALFHGVEVKFSRRPTTGGYSFDFSIDDSLYVTGGISSADFAKDDPNYLQELEDFVLAVKSAR